MRWGTLAPAPPTRPPRPLTQRERPTWDPLSSDGAVPAPRCRGPPFPMPLGRPAPHLSRPLPLGPRRARQRRLGERWEACISLRGADGGGTRKAERPAPRARPSRPATRAWGGGMPNNTVQPGSSSETTPQPVPSHSSGLRSSPYPALPQLPVPRGRLWPRPQHGGTGCACDPPSCCLRLWAPTLCQARRDQKPGHGRKRRTEGPGRGDAHTQELAEPAAARLHRASRLLPRSQL